MAVAKGMDKDVITYIRWNITQPLKEWNNAMYDNMAGPREWHTEWSKSDREWEILYDIPYMWTLKGKDTNEIIYKTERESQT